MLWCQNCKMPVNEAIAKPSMANPHAQICPKCKAELVEAGTCRWCGEPISPDRSECKLDEWRWRNIHHTLVWSVMGAFKVNTDLARDMLFEKMIDWNDEEEMRWESE